MATSTVSVLFNSTVTVSDTSIEFDVPWAPPSDISNSLCYLKVSNFFVDITLNASEQGRVNNTFLLDSFLSNVQNTSYEYNSGTESRGVRVPVASYKKGDSQTPYPVLVQIPSGENSTRFRLRMADGGFLSDAAQTVPLTISFVMSIVKANSRSAPI